MNAALVAIVPLVIVVCLIYRGLDFDDPKRGRCMSSNILAPLAVSGLVGMGGVSSHLFPEIAAVQVPVGMDVMALPQPAYPAAVMPSSPQTPERLEHDPFYFARRFGETAVAETAKILVPRAWAGDGEPGDVVHRSRPSDEPFPEPITVPQAVGGFCVLMSVLTLISSIGLTAMIKISAAQNRAAIKRRMEMLSEECDGNF